jgi:hypothetical protein
MLHRWLLRQITHRVAHRTTSYTTAAATSSRPRPPFDESPAPRKPLAPCPRSLAASRRRYMSCCGLQRSWRRRRRGRSRTAGGDPQTRGSNRGRNACSRVTRTSSSRSPTQNVHPRRLARLPRARSPQQAEARARTRRRRPPQARLPDVAPSHSKTTTLRASSAVVSCETVARRPRSRWPAGRLPETTTRSSDQRWAASMPDPHRRLGPSLWQAAAVRWGVPRACSPSVTLPRRSRHGVVGVPQMCRREQVMLREHSVLGRREACGDPLEVGQRGAGIHRDVDAR